MSDLTATDHAGTNTAGHGAAGSGSPLERHRTELTGYCYRMLGAAFEAEDAVQETLVRAWRSLDRFDAGRASLRSWLYKIATNVCIDMLNGRQRRARPMDLGPASAAGATLGPPLPDATWIEPIPDRRALPVGGDPAEMAVARETIHLAFVAALQHLPPRQRAVLILREVLRWKAAEVAELLDTTVPSVNSALQRARSTLRDRRPAPSEPYQPLDEAQQRLLARYADAFERYDIDTLVSLLHEDATTAMPPFQWWLRGRAAIRSAFLGSDGTCANSRLVPVVANGSPAFGQYIPSGRGGAYEPWALLVVEISGGLIVGTTTFLSAARLFPLFDLPLDLSGPRTDGDRNGHGHR
jgi:RNA polymerase sigma-70 factor (ECF subfamily)